MPDAPDSSFLNFRAFGEPKALSRYGDFQSDVDSIKYNMSWPSWTHFEAFLAAEQEKKKIELHKCQTRSGGKRYIHSINYTCSRWGTGGEKV